MVEKTATFIVRKMQKEQLLNQNMEENNIYAMITLMEKWITLTTVMLMAFLFGKVVPTICFLIFFFSLRKRTGGCHAKEFWICYMESNITYILLVFICPIIMKYENVMYGLLFLSGCVIWRIGTINHPNINMNKKEIKESKMMARCILLIELTIIYSFSYFGVDKISLSFMSLAVILCAMLLGIAKIIKQEV